MHLHSLHSGTTLARFRRASARPLLGGRTLTIYKGGYVRYARRPLRGTAANSLIERGPSRPLFLGGAEEFTPPRAAPRGSPVEALRRHVRLQSIESLAKRSKLDHTAQMVGDGKHDVEVAAQRVVATRWRIGAALTALMMLAYFGFIVLVAYGKPVAGALVADGQISVGIILGACTILLAPVLTAIYVRWANRKYDPAIAELKKRRAS
jgi:uncharacterized membrane protein (DUF485 family)